MKTVADILNKKHIGMIFNFRGYRYEVILNDFSNKLALDNDRGQVSLDELEIDNTCPICEGYGMTFGGLCPCIRVVGENNETRVL